MEKYALIVAGGSGLRMGKAVPKQFLLLHGKPLLWHSILAFCEAFTDINIILVVPPLHLGNELLQQLPSKNVSLIAGGDTRFASVKNGLEKVPDNAVVFVHDAVRCLVSKPLILRCYEQTITKGNAVPVIAATDSLRISKEGSHCVIDRQQIRIVQTPQTFMSNDIKEAFGQPYIEAFTDEATVLEAYGKEVFLTEGDYENIKITKPLDLLIAEQILKERSSFQKP